MRMQNVTPLRATAVLCFMAVASPAYAATDRIFYEPAFRFPMSYPMLAGIAMTVISLFAGHVSVKPAIRRFDLPIAAINLAGLALLVTLIFANNRMRSFNATPAELAISLSEIAVITTQWIVIAQLRQQSPWSSLKIATALCGAILLLTPVGDAYGCGSACYGRQHPF